MSEPETGELAAGELAAGELAAGELAAGVLAGDRRALARAITLVESARPEDHDRADQVLQAVLGRTGGGLRVGVSGAPGAGKSTFIEALGARLTAAGHQVAVLAVDPSSHRTGGSILADKTRMPALARNPAAFIRPSASRGSLGGVARRTREAALLCEAAGFDVVLVETVGVGQSEVEVDQLVDVFVLLVQPGGGGDLQGIKRGVMELADVVVITKADGALAALAEQAQADYRHALQLLRPKHAGWEPPALRCSSVTGEGVAEVWEAVSQLAGALRSSCELDRRRRRQARSWMWTELREALVAELLADPAVAAAIAALEGDVADGRTTPWRAAASALAAFRRG